MMKLKRLARLKAVIEILMRMRETRRQFGSSLNINEISWLRSNNFTTA